MRVPLKITLMAALLVAVSASSSWALIETYLPGGAKVTMKFTNYDEGTKYYNLTSGTAYEGATLAALQWKAAYDPLATGAYRVAGDGVPKDINGIPLESTWGIFKLSEIYDTNNSSIVYWSRSTSSFEITGMFWGEVDKYVLWDGTSQTIKGNDLEFAFYEDTTPDYDFLPGPTIRSGNTYATATDGTCIWTGTSTPGSTDASPYEFYAKFSPGNGLTEPEGTGSFLGITSAVSGHPTGSLNYLLADYAPNIQFSFKFTSSVDGVGNTGWDLSSEDPVRVRITPELSTSWLMLLGMVPVGMAWRRRKRS